MSNTADEPLKLAVIGDGHLRIHRSSTEIKRRVCNLGTWLEAWTVFCRVLVDAAPELAPDVLQYQSIITEASAKYSEDAWLTYDRRFRMALAAQPHRFAWGVIDPNLWQSCMTGKALPSCPRCRLSHPTPGPFCPFGQGLHPLRRSAVEARPAKRYSPTAENRFAETSTPDRAIPRSIPALTFAFRAEETTPPTHAAQVTPKPRPPLPETPNKLIHPPLHALIHTLVHVQRLCSLLSRHPEKSISNYVSQGMSQGFAVGFRSQSAPLARLCSSSNHPSALRNRQFVSTYLQSSCDSSQTAGPFTQPPFPHMYVSGLGIVPKKNGKLRVIHDLSSPDGESVNDGVPREDFSPEYATVDMAISHIMAVGPGAYLTKVDVRSAFRLCPVHPADWFLLGICWEKHYYYDRVLPFGLRSAPYIFNKFADGLQWILQDTGNLPCVIHYLDDFLDITTANQAQAQHHHDLKHLSNSSASS